MLMVFVAIIMRMHHSCHKRESQGVKLKSGASAEKQLLRRFYLLFFILFIAIKISAACRVGGYACVCAERFGKHAIVSAKCLIYCLFVPFPKK